MNPIVHAVFGLAVLLPCAAAVGQEQVRELVVHLAQANNIAPYSFVRAKFQPGEVPDPWAVRFFDKEGKEVPYFVWDSVTWKTAREGRPDWGHRYALLNHVSGDSPAARENRAKILALANENFPELGATLTAEDQAARKFEDSVCAALYLLRYTVPAHGKEKLTLRVYSKRPVEPVTRSLKDKTVSERFAIRQGDLQFENLPDGLTVTWKGKEVFRYAGFEAGEAADTSSHADPAQPFSAVITEGIITKVYIEGRTKGRRGGLMDWQCTYWLCPEGSYTALEGFSLEKAEGYLGGDQKVSIWKVPADFKQIREPLWESPWSLHQIGDGAYVAVYQYHDTPLTVGYGNNPFTANPAGLYRPERAWVEIDGRRLALQWRYDLNDRGVLHLFNPIINPGNLGYWDWLTPEVLSSKKITNPPAGMDQETVRSMEEALKFITWHSKVDWFFRQYMVSVGEESGATEIAVRDVLGAAGGWIDRPFTQEEIADLAGKAFALGLSQQKREPPAQYSLLGFLPYLFNQPDASGVRQALRTTADAKDQTDAVIKGLKTHIERGGDPIKGSADGSEGWENNPSYFATDLPTWLRFAEHFELTGNLKYPALDYRDAVLRFADFTLEILGGNPPDFAKFQASCRSSSPGRMVMMIPLMLHAYTLKSEQKYAQAARMLFDDFMATAEKNPHGYWSVSEFEPKRARVFDTVYNPICVHRGIGAFWADGQLEVIGREKAANFATAQARWLVVSRQLLDTLETDNMTAVQAFFHHAHPSILTQMPLYFYDDFMFYRGLFGNIIRWSAPLAKQRVEGARGIDMMSYGAYMSRWTMGISPGSRWLECRTQVLPNHRGFRVQFRNNLPWSRPSLWVYGHEAGLAMGQPLLWIELREPAWGYPPLLEVLPGKDAVVLRVYKRAGLRLNPQPLLSDAAPEKAIFTYRGPDGKPQDITKAVSWSGGFAEWDAQAGEYELKLR
ncbi:MAG: hypothetical protein HY717_16990 [Planctomycetes bacterium]|nr:hypothetical protein [Planctomycetota bacterium]